MQRAANQHLPGAEQQRQTKDGEGQPEMREDEPLIDSTQFSLRRVRAPVAGNASLSITFTCAHMP